MKKLLTLILCLSAAILFAQTSGNSPYDPGAARKNLSNVDALQLKLGAGTAAAPAYTFSSDPDTGIYSPGANAIGFGVGGAENARISAGGNLIIATTTDDGANKLQVNGGLRATDITAKERLLFENTTFAGGYNHAIWSQVNVGNVYVGSGSLSLHTFVDNSGAQLVSLTPPGNVLIATTTDDGANKLQVNGSMRLIGMAAPTATEGGIYFNSTDKHLYVYNGTGWVQLDN